MPRAARKPLRPPPNASALWSSRARSHYVKVALWKRDHGKRVLCASQKNLHYDHDPPYSNGGSSITLAKVRLLCAMCKLKKSTQIGARLPLQAGLAAFRR